MFNQRFNELKEHYINEQDLRSMEKKKQREQSNSRERYKFPAAQAKNMNQSENIKVQETWPKDRSRIRPIKRATTSQK